MSQPIRGLAVNSQLVSTLVVAAKDCPLPDRHEFTAGKASVQSERLNIELDAIE